MNDLLMAYLQKELKEDIVTLKTTHTVLFSTVRKPTSEILGSFSPSSKAYKTLVASENIPRSVRTRTCNEIQKTHKHFHRERFNQVQKFWEVQNEHFAFLHLPKFN